MMDIPELRTIIFEQNYAILLDSLIFNGATQVNSRTGQKTHVHRGAYSFSVPVADGIPVPGNRVVRPGTAAAEIAWFLKGSQNLEWLRRHAKIWDKFTEEDQVSVKNAYGWRWRKAFNRDQIQEAVDTLRSDPTSRQVVVSAWDPRIDGLQGARQRNIPCPTHFSLNILEGKLYCALFLRSSDAFVGLPYDIMGQALLMKIFAETLQVPLGHLHVTLAHVHLYDAHFAMALESLCGAHVRTPSDLPKYPEGWNLAEVEACPDDYVQAVKACGQAVTWPAFNPKPEVIG